MSKLKKAIPEDHKDIFSVQGSRRKFLAYSGATMAASSLLLYGCNEDEDMPTLTNLSPPTNLTADNSVPGQVTLSWTDNSKGEDGFRIQRSAEKDSGFTKISKVGADIHKYVDESVDGNSEYFYRVQVFKGNEASSYSAVVSSHNGSEPVYLGTGDVGILNYAYALEQLEAAFYTMVLGGGYYANANDEEKKILSDVQKHEVIHREFFKAALTAVAPDKIIPPLSVDFSAVDFDDRASVLGTAKVFEDLGVSAYNGAGQFLVSPVYLTLAGKIVSVEARHASAIRDLLEPSTGAFAGDDIINDNGLEVTRSIPDVLGMASAYIVTELDASGLPTDGFQIPLPS